MMSTRRSTAIVVSATVASLLSIAAVPVTRVSAQAAPPSYDGVVTTGGVPIPGATVAAVRGERTIAASTDEDGRFRLMLAEDGVWQVRVEMRGFAPLTRDLTWPAEGPAVFELALLPFAEIAREAIVARPPEPAGAPDARSASSAQAGRNAPAPAPVPSPADPAPGGLGLLAADGFLINGSVNNGAASPFAQLRAFGNNRPGQRSLYNWSLGMVAGHSALDARPFSFADRQAPKPDYGDLHIMGTFGGPVRIPGARPSNIFVGYQRVAEHSATTQTARVPTTEERNGQLGVPVSPEQISAQARALLALYPLPNIQAAGGENYQTTLVRGTTQHSVQSRVGQPISNRNQLAGTFAYQRTTTDSTNLFGLDNAATISGVDGAATWSYRVSPLMSLRLRYQFTHLANEVTPHFAGRRNVSNDAGIAGNSQDPSNWGPPALVFANGIAGLSDVDFASTGTNTHGIGIETFATRGRHALTVGGGIRWHALNVSSQQNPRGTFTFTGAASGDPFADFLLGLPQASSISFGTGEKRYRHSSYDAFISDDWRVSPSLTITAGVRWEYEAPVTERSGDLVNLDIAPGFTAARPVLATDPTGPVTGEAYPSSLLRPDKSGVQPRVGLAWRPVAGSSLVVRAGYGIYRNTSVYESIARLLGEQPPLSTTMTVETSPAAPLTLANGFVAEPGATLNTFAVDPEFHVGYAQNWQVSMQRDLPASLTMTATYLGTNGRHLMQQLLPNTYPPGISNPCPECPAGFVYLTSNGRSNRHASQFQVRRRLRSGFAASVQYTLAKAEDDAAAFGGASVAGASIAQDWLNVGAEYAPSNFDQRHLLAVELEYTTGMGAAGGALLDGIKGRLFKGWTVTSQLNMGSGLPFTPGYLRTVPGTGVTGTIRPVLTGASLDAPSSLYLNPAAYAPPPEGQWGNAGRNSITGPSQFSMNAGVSRTFLLGDRLSLDWRIDATNVLNRVTYAGVDAILGSPQFGRPTRANAMRKLQTTARLRF
jgi:hypothetical protein